MNAPKVNKRILALDILRGFTIAGMILVNNPEYVAGLLLGVLPIGVWSI